MLINISIPYSPPDLTGQDERGLRGSVGLSAAPCCVGSPYPLKTYLPHSALEGGNWESISSNQSPPKLVRLSLTVRKRSLDCGRASPSRRDTAHSWVHDPPPNSIPRRDVAGSGRRRHGTPTLDHPRHIHCVIHRVIGCGVSPTAGTGARFALRELRMSESIRLHSSPGPLTGRTARRRAK